MLLKTVGVLFNDKTLKFVTRTARYQKFEPDLATLSFKLKKKKNDLSSRNICHPFKKENVYIY